MYWSSTAPSFLNSMTQARNRSRRSRAAAAETPSALLQFLEQLDDDTFQQTLLPMLIADNSATNLAETCSQLRKLCHSSVKKLDLRPLLRDDVQPSDAQQWTQHLQEHFPGCSSVLLQVDEQDSYLAVSYMLPALARLPNLGAMKLDVRGPQALQVLPMAMLLLSVRTQLTGLQSLTLELSQSWDGARSSWAELAGMTQLTKLHITSINQVGGQCHRTDLLQLSRLCGLQDLSIDLSCRNQAEPLVSFKLVSQMSALTALRLSARSADGFGSLSSCVNLQQLDVLDQTGVSFDLSATDWCVLGQLTQLTKLDMWPVHLGTDCGACCLALQQLTGLHELSAGALASGVLAGLRHLPHLTSLGGDFLPIDGLDMTFTCVQVAHLWASSGHLPCDAFPNLLHVHLHKRITSDALAALSTHCHLLQSLQHDLPESPVANLLTLPAAEPVADRVAAVRSLSSLQCLRALDFCVQEDAEMHAVCQAAAELARLTQLRIVVRNTSDVTSSTPLFALARVSSIKNLALWVLKPSLLRQADLAKNFVAVLAGVKRLQLVVASELQHTQLSSAFESVESLGLPLPSRYSVSMVG